MISRYHGMSRGRADYSRRDRRSRSKSGSLPIDRSLLMKWNYDDYVQQVSRRFQTGMYSDVGVRPTIPGQQLSFGQDNDLKYEEKVNAFLRGIDSRGRRNNQTFSQSPTRSCSYTPPESHYYDGRGRYRESVSPSRSRSPVMQSRSRKGVVNTDLYDHHVVDYSHKNRSCSKNRCTTNDQLRGQYRGSTTTRHRHVPDNRLSTRRSPRLMVNESSRPYSSNSRHYR